MAFIFDPSKGETPESLRKKREIAKALSEQASGFASSPGEGLAMIGAAIGSRIADSKANKIEASGREQASSALAPIMAALGGGGSSAASSSSSSPSAPQAASIPAPAASNSALPSSFLSALDKHEGGGAYDTLFGFSQKNGPFAGTDVSKMTIGQALDFANPSGQYANYVKGKVGRVATPMGRHQIVGTTLRNAANEMGLSPDTPFSPEVQDRIAFHLAKKRVQGAGDLSSKISGLRSEWAGFKSVPDAEMAQIVSEIEGGAVPSAYQQTASAASPAAQAVNAMAQGGQPASQPTPQGAGATGMDVWQGRAQQGIASDGSQLVRTPEGVQRTSTKGYSEIIRPEGMPSERAPMPMQGQGGGIGAILSSLLGRGGQQQAPQAMPVDPIQYNAGVMRMSPDLAGGLVRQPVPQGQPPIPGIQPSPMTMAEMGGRMPAPQGQPMPQGVDALRTALQPTPQAPQQAMPAPQATMAPPPAQAAPQPAQAGANGISLPQLLQIAQNPWVAENKLYSGIVTTLIENQLSMNKPMNPLEKAQLEKLMLDIEQQRNPVAKPTSDMTEYDLYVEQATASGQQPMPFLDYQQALKKSGATNVTTNVGEGDKFYENLDKKNAETFSALSETGMQARSKLAQIGRLEELLKTAPSGASAMLKQAAGEYGINTEGLDDLQAATALINKMVPEQREPGSGPMSDRDIELFRASLPRTINQPGGNELITQTLRGIAQYEIKMGEIADAVSNREMTPAAGRKAIASLENPLAGFGRKAKEMGGQSGPAGVPAGVDPAVWEVMTPDERALFQ